MLVKTTLGRVTFCLVPDEGLSNVNLTAGEVDAVPETLSWFCRPYMTYLFMFNGPLWNVSWRHWLSELICAVRLWKGFLKEIKLNQTTRTLTDGSGNVLDVGEETSQQTDGASHVSYCCHHVIISWSASTISVWKAAVMFCWWSSSDSSEWRKDLLAASCFVSKMPKAQTTDGDSQ